MLNTIYRVLKKSIEKPKSQTEQSKIRESNNDSKVKNDNGPISVFICTCFTPR